MKLKHECIEVTLQKGQEAFQVGSIHQATSVNATKNICRCLLILSLITRYLDVKKNFDRIMGMS
jgi:hypothetical protein